jgi:hypothetical protein
MRAALALAFAACASACTTPGTGWSRAPDLAVYAAMDDFATIAREQEVLCAGFSPASVDTHWQADFGPRDAGVRAALVSLHGLEAVDDAVAARPPRVPCETVPTARWRHRYERLLRLLETRLGPA